VPGIEILAPSDYQELRRMIRYAVERAVGPVAVRYPRGKGPEDLLPSSTDEEDVTRSRRLLAGEDATVVTVGTMAERCLEAARMVAEEGIACEVIDVRRVKPFDQETLFRSVERTGAVLVVEDGTIAGGFGQTFLAQLQESGLRVSSARIACADHPLHQGTRDQLYRQEGMDAPSIAEALRRLLAAKKP